MIRFQAGGDFHFDLWVFFNPERLLEVCFKISTCVGFFWLCKSVRLFALFISVLGMLLSAPLWPNTRSLFVRIVKTNAY